MMVIPERTNGSPSPDSQLRAASIDRVQDLQKHRLQARDMGEQLPATYGAPAASTRSSLAFAVVKFFRQLHRQRHVADLRQQGGYFHLPEPRSLRVFKGHGGHFTRLARPTATGRVIAVSRPV